MKKVKLYGGTAHKQVEKVDQWWERETFLLGHGNLFYW